MTARISDSAKKIAVPVDFQFEKPQPKELVYELDYSKGCPHFEHPKGPKITPACGVWHGLELDGIAYTQAGFKHQDGVTRGNYYYWDVDTICYATHIIFKAREDSE